MSSFDVTIRAVAGFKIREKVHLVLGVDADPFEEDWATPICGFNWEVNDQCNLRAVFPDPRFSYTPNKKLEFFVAADLVGGGYRNGPTDDRQKIEAFFRKWLRRLPHPFSAQERRAGYRYDLSLLQAKFSLKPSAETDTGTDNFFLEFG